MIVTGVLDTPDGGAADARAAFTRQQRVYERMQAGRGAHAGLVPDPGGDGGLARGAIDAYVQAGGPPDAVVATLTGLLDALAGWPDVHLVLRILYGGTDLEVERRRVVAFGRDVLPRLRAHRTEGVP